jgi:anti-sigma factor RsiW
MECMDVRKKLKDYVKDEITDKSTKLEMEEHINTCPICKKELLMWQDVIDRQRGAGGKQAAGMPKELMDRIRYRTARAEKISKLPAFFRIKRAPGGFWNSMLGMIIQIAFILVSGIIFGLLLGIKRHGHGIVVPLLVLFGFTILFILMLIKGRKKP